MAKSRDRETGRYQHEWGVVGQNDSGREVAFCDHCGLFHAYGGGRDEKLYTTEKALKDYGEPTEVKEN